jgi:hypothetical protein
MCCVWGGCLCVSHCHSGDAGLLFMLHAWTVWLSAVGYLKRMLWVMVTLSATLTLSADQFLFQVCTWKFSRLIFRNCPISCLSIASGLSNTCSSNSTYWGNRADEISTQPDYITSIGTLLGRNSLLFVYQGCCNFFFPGFSSLTVFLMCERFFFPNYNCLRMCWWVGAWGAMIRWVITITAYTIIIIRKKISSLSYIPNVVWSTLERISWSSIR